MASYKSHGLIIQRQLDLIIFFFFQKSLPFLLQEKKKHPSRETAENLHKKFEPHNVLLRADSMTNAMCRSHLLAHG